MSAMVQFAGKRQQSMVGKTTIRQRRHKNDAISVQIARYSRRSLPGIIVRPPVSPLTPPLEESEDVDPERKNKKIRTEEPDLDESYIMKREHFAVYRLLVGNVLEFHMPPRRPYPPKYEPTITGLPTEILRKIFKELEVPSQICLALANKTFAKASYCVNPGSSITYTRGERLRLLWRLSTWMSEQRTFCHSCEMYYPVSPSMWKQRRDSGFCNTRNVLYGRIPEDFVFEDGKCPECVAEKAWKWLKKSRTRLQAALA